MPATDQPNGRRMKDSMDANDLTDLTYEVVARLFYGGEPASGNGGTQHTAADVDRAVDSVMFERAKRSTRRGCKSGWKAIIRNT